MDWPLFNKIIQAMVEDSDRHEESKSDGAAKRQSEATPGRIAGRDAPLGGEQPQSISEVPGGAKIPKA